MILCYIKNEIMTRKLHFMTDLYKKVEQFVKESFKKAGKEASVKHFIRTAYWINVLEPNADEALLISGVSHDIEQAFNGDWVKGSIDPNILKKHQNLSAEKFAEFLKSINAESVLIDRVKMLVSHHEDGGNDDQNVLKDADCISYFENQALRHAVEWQKNGKSIQDIKKKFNYTFDKITSLKARQIANPMYEDAIRTLNIKLIRR